MSTIFSRSKSKYVKRKTKTKHVHSDQKKPRVRFLSIIQQPCRYSYRTQSPILQLECLQTPVPEFFHFLLSCVTSGEAHYWDTFKLRHHVSQIVLQLGVGSELETHVIVGNSGECLWRIDSPLVQDAVNAESCEWQWGNQRVQIRQNSSIRKI